MSRGTKNAAVALNNELLTREITGLSSFCMEDDYVAGFMAGQANAEMREDELVRLLESLLQLAAARNEMHSLAYTRFIIRRLGHVIKK